MKLNDYTFFAIFLSKLNRINNPTTAKIPVIANTHLNPIIPAHHAPIAAVIPVPMLTPEL